MPIVVFVIAIVVIGLLGFQQLKVNAAGCQASVAFNQFCDVYAFFAVHPLAYFGMLVTVVVGYLVVTRK